MKADIFIAYKPSLSLMGERIRVGLGANPLRNPKYSEANPCRRMPRGIKVNPFN
jgi:hypothetical protein